MNSFLIDFQFEDTISGFSVRCEGGKGYSIDYYESVDCLINDVLKLLKSKRNSLVTFQLWTGYSTTDLLRLGRDWSGTMTAYHWKYNKSGLVSEKWQDEEIKITKSNVKKYVLEALELYREADAA